MKDRSETTVPTRVRGLAALVALVLCWLIA